MDCIVLSLLQGIFPTQGSNPGLLHYRQILYRLSLQGSPSRVRLDHSIQIAREESFWWAFTNNILQLARWPMMAWFYRKISHSFLFFSVSLNDVLSKWHQVHGFQNYDGNKAQVKLLACSLVTTYVSAFLCIFFLKLKAFQCWGKKSNTDFCLAL